MRSENAIMPSRREFLSDALGIGLVTASTWSIRDGEAPFDVRTIRQKCRQLRTCNQEYIPDVGGVPGAEHTRYRARCASRRNSSGRGRRFRQR